MLKLRNETLFEFDVMFDMTGSCLPLCCITASFDTTL